MQSFAWTVSVPSPIISLKLVLQSQPTDVELSIIERAQLLHSRQTFNMSIPGKTMHAVYLRRLLIALKPSSSKILECQANSLSDYPPRPKEEGVQLIYVSRLAERNKVHADTLFCNV
jgi:hypothetical protein